jgi:hypothetical protein
VELKMPNGRCEVKANGKVSCVPSTEYFVLCKPDLTYWPYDKVNCSLLLGAWMQRGEEINITTGQEYVSTKTLESVKAFKYRKIRLHAALLSEISKKAQQSAKNCSNNNL